MTDKRDFIKTDYGWELSNSGKFFWEKEVTVVVNTKTDTEHSDKEIFKEQIETLKMISDAWQELIFVIEQEIVAYEGKTKDELLAVVNLPRIMLDIDYDTNKPEAKNRWSFVLGVLQNDDFAWHVELEGNMHIDTWAGG